MGGLVSQVFLADRDGQWNVNGGGRCSFHGSSSMGIYSAGRSPFLPPLFFSCLKCSFHKLELQQPSCNHGVTFKIKSCAAVDGGTNTKKVLRNLTTWFLYLLWNWWTPHLKWSQEARRGSSHTLLLVINCTPQQEETKLAFPTGWSPFYYNSRGRKNFSLTSNKLSQ